MKILTTPDPFLRHQAKPLATWDKKTAKQAAEMVEILKNTTNPQGVGLAATQVGLDKRFFLAIVNHEVKIFVNPKIVKASKKMLSGIHKSKKDRWLEGCLSIPKIWGFVDRPFTVTLQYQTTNLALQTETFSDAEAAYIQHELDHLNGILFTDRIIAQGGRLYQETDSGLKPFKF